MFEGRELVAKDTAGQVLSTMVVDNAEAAEIWLSLKAAKIITKEKQASNDFKELSEDEKNQAIFDALDEEFKAYNESIKILIESVYDPNVPLIDDGRKRISLKLDKEKLIR
ncbi:hypothetical protein RyT2_06450 [Pseudolactococcus yaeyamensis]